MVATAAAVAATVVATAAATTTCRSTCTSTHSIMAVYATLRTRLYRVASVGLVGHINTRSYWIPISLISVSWCTQ